MNNNKRVFVDIHVIQSLPPSCVNRDDTGRPKTAVYGGVRRARVSSQAWKRAMRTMFEEKFDERELGERTKRITEKVAEQIQLLKSDYEQEDAMRLAEKILKRAGLKPKEAKTLFYMSYKQAENLAKMALITPLPSKIEVQEALNAGKGVELSFFGRMVAEEPDLNTEASVQVAHAISTHRVDNEFDYFVAIDDRKLKEKQTGAGMVDTTEFNSSTVYRYATVAVHELERNLDNTNAVAKAVKEFVRAFVCSMPTGKQNAFANHTLPYLAMVVLSQTQPVNLVGAFEEPVKLKAGDGGYQRKSAEILAKHMRIINDKYFSEETTRSKNIYLMALDDDVAELFMTAQGTESEKINLNLSELLDKTEASVDSFLRKDAVQA